MGILPLEFMPGENAESLGLTGKEQYSIDITEQNIKVGQVIDVQISIFRLMR